MSAKATAENVPNNLPLRLTSFIGREAEIVEAGRLLAEKRMLTLTGSGGCGKSRLALRVAADVVDHYPDGAWLVDLAPLSDPALLPATVAATLSIKEPPGADLVEVLCDRLRSKALLLIADNCEHLVRESGELVEALLRGCPFVVVLVTSREPLGIEGEMTFRVPSLSVPLEDADFDAVERSEAVQLFADRARGARSDFQLTEPVGSCLAEICRRLDGIPLAIELAAARARVLSPQQILDGLTDRFGLLTGGLRTALPRQRTLQASVDWSYALLTDDERSLLRRLSVFAGSFSLDAVEEVCSGEGIERGDILDLLSHLVDKSLVQAEKGTGAVRYRLLETIRDYAGGKLAESGEAPATRDRHFDFFLSLAEEAEPALEGREQLAWLDRLDRERPNLRAAAEWAGFSGQVMKEASLAGGLWFYYFLRTYLSEARLRIVDRLPPPADAEPRVRVRPYICAAWYYLYSGDLARGTAPAAEAATIAKAASDPWLAAGALHTLAWNECLSGRDAAREHFEEAITTARQGDSLFILSLALSGSGYQLSQAGETARARKSFEESLVIGRRIGNAFVIQLALALAGTHHNLIGEFERARNAFGEGIRIGRDLGDVYFVSLQSTYLTEALTLSGELEAARHAAEEGLRAARDANSDFMRAANLAYQGLLDAHAGDLESSMRHLDEAVAFGRERTYRGLTSQWLVLEGSVELLKGNVEGAAARWDEALEIARETSNAPGLARALQAQALLARMQGDMSRAESCELEALEVGVRSEFVPTVIDSLESLAGIAAAFGRHPEAARLFGAAEAQRRRISYVRSPMLDPMYRGDVQAVREAQGDETFEETWHEGAGMSLEQAVALGTKGRGRRKRPSFGWASLTPVEIDVVKLAAQGLTNPQIGEKLFVSKRTIQTHLARIFRKLGISTRSELAAEAVRHGL